MWSCLTLGQSFKVKQWFTSFDALSFQWMQICIGSQMHWSSCKIHLPSRNKTKQVSITNSYGRTASTVAINGCF